MERPRFQGVPLGVIQLPGGGPLRDYVEVDAARHTPGLNRLAQLARLQVEEGVLVVRIDAPGRPTQVAAPADNGGSVAGELLHDPRHRQGYRLGAGAAAQQVSQLDPHHVDLVVLAHQYAVDADLLDHPWDGLTDGLPELLPQDGFPHLLEVLGFAEPDAVQQRPVPLSGATGDLLLMASGIEEGA